MSTATVSGKKTDVQLQRDVLDELIFEPSLNATDIGVIAKDGIITLTGTVESYHAKHVAERAAERVAGVRAIADKLEVRLPLLHKRTDTDIARAVANALEWNVNIPHERIKARVENGIVTLEGDVDWYYQKTAAQDSIRELSGVRGITNRITVKPTLVPKEIKAKIESTFKRYAMLDSKNIEVEVLDRKVILRGNVATWAERNEATRAAWSAPGVAEVDNQLTVRS